MKSRIVILIAFLCTVPLTGLSETIGGGDLRFTPKNALPVVFSHSKHVSEFGLKCTGCHYTIFQKQYGAFHMEMDQIKKGQFCGKCHNGTKAFDVKESRNCVRCHKDTN